MESEKENGGMFMCDGLYRVFCRLSYVCLVE